jgi:glucokinase
MSLLAGIDIGGTKCAVCLGRPGDQGDGLELLAREAFPTPPGPEPALAALGDALWRLLETERQNPGRRQAASGAGEAGSRLAAIGVSCGGPLDGARGLILSPPNLPGWDRVDVLTPFRQRFGVPAALQNDANACALAEWRWGAGRGCRSLVFLTFGTGMGAGLILDGRLYVGASDMAGEVGHVRLAEDGPPGYGKRGAFEGFCSGGGIARLARQRAEAAIGAGRPPAFCPTPDALPGVTAEKVALAAQQGDGLALEIFDTVGQYLGRGLALIVDVLNPERIVVGSIYARQRALLEPVALRVLREEAHPHALAACQVVPSALGEHVGDYAGLAVAELALGLSVSPRRSRRRGGSRPGFRGGSRPLAR